MASPPRYSPYVREPEGGALRITTCPLSDGGGDERWRIEHDPLKWWASPIHA